MRLFKHRQHRYATMTGSPSQRSALRESHNSADGTSTGSSKGYGATKPRTHALSAKIDVEPGEGDALAPASKDVVGDFGDKFADASGSLLAGSDGSLQKGPRVGEGDVVVKTPLPKQALTQQILSLTLPALVSLSVDPLMSAVDTIYVGRLGEDLGGGEIGLGALAINSYLFFFSFFVFNFLATVPTPFVASARASGDEVGAASLVGQLLSSALALGFVLTVVLEFSAPFLLHLMGATSANEVQAMAFFRARALSAPAVLVMNVANGAFRGYLDTRTPLFISLGANAVNFVLDPLLIFYAGLGLQGAAIATVAAEWTAASVFLVLLSKKDPVIRPRMFSLPTTGEGWREVNKVLTSSAAVFGRTIALQTVLSTATAFAARAGTTSVAAHQVVSQFWVILSFVADSLAVAAQGLIADRMGGGSLPAAREVASRVLLIGAIWGAALLLAFQLFGDVLPQIFTNDKQVLSAAAPIMVLVGWVQPVTAYVYVGDGILQGSQDFLYEAFTMVVSASLSIGYIVSRAQWGWGGADFGLLDVWIGLTILSCSRAVTFSLRHWLDPRGPLALSREETPSSKMTRVGLEGGTFSSKRNRHT